MITRSEPLSLAEAEKLVGTLDENKELKAYIKKFSKIKLENVAKLKADIEKLDNMKIKPEHTIKLIDMLPEDREEVNKIFVDVGLNEDETSQILEIVKKYR